MRELYAQHDSPVVHVLEHYPAAGPVAGPVMWCGRRITTSLGQKAHAGCVATCLFCVAMEARCTASRA